MRGVRVLQEDQHLADGEQSDDRHDRMEAIEQVEDAEGEARRAADRVKPDRTERQAEGGGHQGLRRIGAGDAADGGESQQVEGEILGRPERSEEHTSELQSLMRISYAVFCLKKKKHNYQMTTHSTKDQ